MNCRKTNILSLLQGGTHFLIPCYQRSYAWTQEQCSDLWLDLKRLVAQREQFPELNAVHFMGSIVVQAIQYAPSAEHGAREHGVLIIDGQQRLTTMYLLYLALAQVARQRLAQNAEYAALVSELDAFLQDACDKEHGTGWQPPFTLSGTDQVDLKRLVAGYEERFNQASLLTSNYQYFCLQLAAETDLWALYEATRALELVEMSLERGDDAQLIFETLNARGLPLTTWDKIRNFALMDLDYDDSQRCYQNLWQPLEQYLHASEHDDFIYFYLEVKRQTESNLTTLYYDFKQWCQASGRSKEAVLQDLLLYAELFAQISYCHVPLVPSKELDPKERSGVQAQLDLCLKRLQLTRSIEWLPFVLACLKRYRARAMSVKELIAVLQLIEVYLARCWLVSLGHQSLESFFITLYQEVVAPHAPSGADRGKAAAIKASIATKAGVASKDGAGASSAESAVGVGAKDNAGAEIGAEVETDFVGRLVQVLRSERASMPDDEQMKKALFETKFNFNSGRQIAMRNYVLARLEEGYAPQDKLAERIPIIDVLWQDSQALTCEHIMPQKLSDVWRKTLGSNYEKIHARWTHRLANLTLTAYNREYANKSFSEKRSMEHGLSQSPLCLNRAIAKHIHWVESDLVQRFDELYQLALKVWPYPKVDG